MARIVSWFSCGNNSAVASKLTLDAYPDDEVVIARCVVENEHPDNDRFHADCEQWFNHPILKIRSNDFKDCWEVWEKRKYLSGIKGAPCTVEMKKAVRWAFEKEWCPDKQVFGFSLEEKKRADTFQRNNPEVDLLTPLIDNRLTKESCSELVLGAGVALPILYGMGFKNNNCVGCVKATSIVYWARVRHFFPAEFSRMSELSRRLGCRLTRLRGTRIFLDQIPADVDWKQSEKSGGGCGLLCAGS